MVREFSVVNREDLTLVRFDPTSRTYRAVSNIPTLHYAGARALPTNPFGVFLRKALLILFAVVRRQNRMMSHAPSFLKNFGKKLWEKYISEYVLVPDEGWEFGPVCVAQGGDTVLVMDVPQNPAHLTFLEKLRIGPFAPQLLVYLHDLIPITQAPIYDPDGWESRLGEFGRYANLVTTADRVVTNSHHTAHEFQQYCLDRNIPEVSEACVIYPPWPAEPTKQSPHTFVSPEVARVVGNESIRRILGVGAIDKRKNFGVLLAALRSMTSEEQQDVALCIVAGSGKLIDPEFLRHYRKLSSDIRKRVFILPSVDEQGLDALYDWANVVCVPSLAEGFGLPVVEAISRGVTPIVSTATALPELADLFNLVSCDPHDPHQWGEALRKPKRLVYDPRVIEENFPGGYVDFFQKLPLGSHSTDPLSRG